VWEDAAPRSVEECGEYLDEFYGDETGHVALVVCGVPEDPLDHPPAERIAWMSWPEDRSALAALMSEHDPQLLALTPRPLPEHHRLSASLRVRGVVWTGRPRERTLEVGVEEVYEQLEALQGASVEHDARREAHRLRVRARAAELVRQSEPMDLPSYVPTHELMERTPEEVDYAVDRLAARKHNIWIPAYLKVGKTLLMQNLVCSLCDGEPFLGELAVKFDRRVLYLDFEQSEDEFMRDQALVGLKNRGRLIYFSLVGRGATLDRPQVEEWVVAAAREHDAGALVIDTYGKAFNVADNDRDTEFEVHARTIDRIKRRGGVDLSFTTDHTPHSAESRGRARGTSAKGGWASAWWSYELTKPNDHTSPRVLSAFGRSGVRMPPRTLAKLGPPDQAGPLRFADAAAEQSAGGAPLSGAEEALLAVADNPDAGAPDLRKFVPGRGDERDKKIQAAQTERLIRRDRSRKKHVFEITDEGRLRLQDLAASGRAPAVHRGSS
jgi:hypothetical protein